MKYCPNCGANIEGLIDHCDCCGTRFESLPFLRWNGFTVSSVGDLCDYLKNIFDYANSKIDNFNLDELPPIVFSVFCYPLDMIDSFNLKNHLYYARTKKMIYATVIIPYDEFLHSDYERKKELVRQSICSSFEKINKSYRKKEPELAIVMAKVIDSL